MIKGAFDFKSCCDLFVFITDSACYDAEVANSPHLKGTREQTYEALTVDNYKVEQIAIFLEDGFNRLADVTSLLAENGINIRILSLADTAAYAILRLIINDTEKAKQILKEGGFTIGGNEVLVIEVPDRPGGTASVLQIIKKNKLEIEYMYAFAQGNGESALIIFRFADSDAAIKVLSTAALRLLTSEEVYAL
jgi:hypothetical protein